MRRSRCWLILAMLCSMMPNLLASCGTIPTTKGAPHLAKPTAALSRQQWQALSQDTQKTLVQRETEWDTIYKDYLQRP